VNSITVTPQLQHVIDRAYPGLSPRQQASKIRGLIHEILLDMILASGEPGTPGRDEFRTSVLPCAGDGHETATPGGEPGSRRWHRRSTTRTG
jgi:hypothetical protein